MWLFIVITLLILLFILGITRKPLRKLKSAHQAEQSPSEPPWGLQQYGVSSEAMLPFSDQTPDQTLFNEMLERMGRDPVEAEITKAILFGLEIALQSDDYARAGIEFEDPAFLEKQLKKIEFELFDSDLYAQYNFYSHSLIVLQDMLEQKRSASEKATIRDAINNYSAKIKEIEPNLKKKFTGQTVAELGTKADRELFYFKMAITNYLRGKDLIPELDRLYYVYGVNYQVEQAFQAVVNELPFFEQLLQTGLRQLAGNSLFELQKVINHALQVSGSKTRLSSSE